jgi:hypothetical protein
MVEVSFRTPDAVVEHFLEHDQLSVPHGLIAPLIM